MTTGFHPLVTRLLRKVRATADAAPTLEAWQELLGLISRTYQDADQDRYTLERSIDISSREMQGLYADLKQRSESEIAHERQRVEESLAILRATLEATDEGILIVDRARRILAANQRYVELTGVPASSSPKAITARCSTGREPTMPTRTAGAHASRTLTARTAWRTTR